MTKILSDAFGKLERDAGGKIACWLPLIDHLSDVAACFTRLCQCCNIRRAMEASARRTLQPRDISRLSALVFLHDLGKANSGFQAKRWARDKIPREWPQWAGHGIEASKIFGEDVPAAIADKLPIEAICTWGEAVDPLLIASISHHGRPIDLNKPIDRFWIQTIWKPVIASDGNIAYDPESVMQQIGEYVLALYPDAFEPGGEPLPDAPTFGHLFAGLVQLADWIGSDTDFFPFAQERTEDTTGLADTAIATLGLDVEEWRKRINASSPKFAPIFDGNAPYPIQAAMDDPMLGPLVILESETGSGKTEAALWRFVHLFRAGLVDGLYFALPTRVSATQAYQRIKEAVERLWPTDSPVTVRALPGYAGADGQDIKLLPDFKVQWPDEPGDELALRRWAAESPKRFLAAPIAVGTIDQALFGALQIRHAHLRYALLSRSLLVVDEVHASDPYMTVLLEQLLSAHLVCGGQALLLSATLGSNARDRYLLLPLRGSRIETPKTPFDEARHTPYPAISDASGITKKKSTVPSKLLFWSQIDAIDDPGRIAQMALTAAEAGAKVLVIRNTVPAAVAVLMALEESNPDPDCLFKVNGLGTLHHGRFSRQDRPVLDEAIQAQLGKNRGSGACIFIGTQTLEQSLDLDADLLITDLCPMDVLLQRVGRLHRHPRPDKERPERFRTALAWVLTPTDHDLTPMLVKSAHGLGRFREGGGIYADLRSVEATRQLIKQHPQVTIPKDNRYLVEAATHTDCLSKIEKALGDDWKKLGLAIQGDTSAQRTFANLHVLNFSEPFGERKDNLFPDDVKIAARLGAMDRLIEFDPPLTGPFGHPLKQLPIPHHLLPNGLSPDTQPDQIDTQSSITEFNLDSARFRYSRLGLERLPD